MTRQLGMADVNQLSMYSPIVSSRRAVPAQPPSVYWATLGSRGSGGATGGGGLARGSVDVGTTAKRGMTLDEWPQRPHAGAGGEVPTAFKRTKAKVSTGLLGLPTPTTTGTGTGTGTSTGTGTGTGSGAGTGSVGPGGSPGASADRN